MSGSEIRIIIDAEDRATPEIKKAMASVNAAQQEVIKRVSGFAPGDRRNFMEEVVNLKTEKQVEGIADQLGVQALALRSVAEGYTGVAAASRKAEKESKKHLTGMQRLRKYTEWRMWRFASGLIFYVGLAGTVKWLYEAGFLINMMNQSSQQLASTWSTIRDHLEATVQTGMGPMGEAMGRWLERAEGIAAKGTASMKAAEEANRRIGPGRTISPWSPWVAGGLSDERAAMPPRERLFLNEYKKLLKFYQENPALIVSKKTAAVALTTADALMKWASAQYDVTKGEVDLRTAILFTSHAVLEYQHYMDLIETGARKRGYWLTTEIAQYRKYALAIVQYGKKQRDLEYMAAGGRGAEILRRLAEYEGVRSGLSGERGRKAALNQAMLLREYADTLEGILPTLTAFSDKWFEVYMNIAKARMEAEKLGKQTYIRQAFGIARAAAARAGIAMTPSGYPLPLPDIRNVTPGIPRAQIEFKGITKEGSRDIEALFGNTVYRLMRSGG